ncbi:acetyl-CoA carboxylase biotin carboxyl carrier protein [Actinoplanes sp. RD1]|uniref:acetyl-CoA carboxylase biotin carboxyl carrier protein n=1 Tax=Actinoplanes sp. RD1 TaxID=3064538 RepID=UPI0027426B29|nr:acetyl-CoA carboxylase biotin carboxyl carrier protein [Actinoplanes sp. RD1]
MTVDVPGPAEQLRMMSREVVREVAEAVGPLHRIRLVSGDISLEVEWPVPVPAAGPPVAAVPAAAAPAPVPAPGTPEPAGSGPGQELRSPLVGTFYQAPEPGAPPFVAVGDVIGPEDQVGIIEAMKLMNPVTAEAQGRVVEILVADGTSVEYDQPLMVIAPVG